VPEGTHAQSVVESGAAGDPAPEAATEAVPGQATTDAEPFDHRPGDDPAAETEPVAHAHSLPAAATPVQVLPLGPALVRPYVARPVTIGAIDPPPARPGRAGRHGLDPAAFATTTELPTVQLTDDDFIPMKPDADMGPQRRKAAFVLMAVVAVLAAIVISVVLVVGHGPAALALPSPTDPGPSSLTGPVLPDPTGPAATPSANPTSVPSMMSTSAAPVTSSAKPPAAPKPTPSPTPTPTTAPLPEVTGPIGSAIADRCVTLNKNSQSPGTLVRAFQCNDTVAQTWTLIGGTIQIHDTLCLQPANQATQAGTGLVVETCDGSAAQQWFSGGGGAVQHAPSGLCLTIPQDSTGNVQLTIDACTGATGQRWTVP
jgi:hypothetical protein